MKYDTHLTAHDFECLFRGLLTRNRIRKLHQHLWLCQECRKRLLEHDEAALYLEEVYGAGTTAKWRKTVEEPLDLLGYAAVATFKAQRFSAAHLRLQTVNSLKFKDVASLVAALERAYGMRKDAPEDSKHLLEGVLQALDLHADWPRAEREYLRARTYAYLGNACRILSRREEAVAWFTKVHEYLAEVEDPGLAGLVSTFEGNMAKDMGEYTLAITKLNQALNLLPSNGETLNRLEAAITLGNCYGRARQLDRCIETLRTTIESHPASDFPPGALLSAMQNLVLRYAQNGQTDEAWDLFPEVKRLAEEEGNRLDLVRVRWTEAEIYKAEGKRTLAAPRFREVQAKFMAAKIPVDAALAGLSQAEMYLDLGDTQAAARLAEDLVPIFRAKGIHREATTAGLIVIEDLRREAATAAQVQELVERLHARGRLRA